MPDQSAAPEKDFEAGKLVFEALKDLPKARQERVIRWVSESLGVALGTPAPVPASTGAAYGAQSLPANTEFSSPPGQSGLVDIASYVREKQPRSDVQFVTVVAHYYKFVAPEDQRLDTINAQVAQDATRLANRDRLARPRKTLNNAKTQGYLDSRARGAYAINTVGENLVARSLPSTSSASAERRPARKASKKPSRKRR